MFLHGRRPQFAFFVSIKAVHAFRAVFFVLFFFAVQREALGEASAIRPWTVWVGGRPLTRPAPEQYSQSSEDVMAWKQYFKAFIFFLTDKHPRAFFFFVFETQTF